MKKIEELNKNIENIFQEMKTEMHMIPLSETNLKEEVEEKSKTLTMTKTGFVSPVILSLITGIVFGIFIGISYMMYYNG